MHEPLFSNLDTTAGRKGLCVWRPEMKSFNKHAKLFDCELTEIDKTMHKLYPESYYRFFNFVCSSCKSRVSVSKFNSLPDV